MSEHQPGGLTVGLIGAGNIAHVHVQSWKALGARVLVHSHDGAAELATQYGLEVAESLDTLFAEVDFVDIVTPSATHKELTLAAIKAGRDVICEKPLTLTAADSRELSEAAAAAGVRIYPAHVVRYFPEYVAAHDAIGAGKIGEVAVARFFRQASSPAERGWYRDVARSGGVIMDLMVHDLDQARWMCGEVTSVYAVQSPPSVAGISPVNVAAHVTLTHEGGAISNLRATWGATGTPFKTGFSIAGSSGVLEYTSDKGTGYAEELQGEAVGGDLLIPSSTLFESPYLTQLRELAAALKGGPEPRVNAADGAAAVYLAEAARESMATGRTIDMVTFIPVWSFRMKVAIASFAHTHASSYAGLLGSLAEVEVLSSDPDGAAAPDDGPRGAAFASKLGVPYVDSYDELFGWGPDAVVVTSENALHRGLVERAAEVGAHVLCEKPLATEVADGEAMLAACEAAGVILMTAYPVRFAPSYGRLRASVEAGRLGDVFAVLGTNNGKIPYAQRQWFTDASLAGGGALVDHTVHCADLIDGLTGGVEAARVHAVANRVLHQDKGVSVETGGLVTITYANGLLATIDCSWSMPDNGPTWGGVTLQVTGTNGSVEIAPFQSHVGGTDASGEVFLPVGGNLDAMMLAEFLTAVRASGPAVPGTTPQWSRSLMVR